MHRALWIATPRRTGMRPVATHGNHLRSSTDVPINDARVGVVPHERELVHTKQGEHEQAQQQPPRRSTAVIAVHAPPHDNDDSRDRDKATCGGPANSKTICASPWRYGNWSPPTSGSAPNYTGLPSTLRSPGSRKCPNCSTNKLPCSRTPATSESKPHDAKTIRERQDAVAHSATCARSCGWAEAATVIVRIGRRHPERFHRGV